MPWSCTRGTIHARNGAVASSQPLASSAGLHILRSGGSFADAAIATSAVLCVVEPPASHIGGDAFVVLWSDGEALAVNGSGISPTGGQTRKPKEERGPGSITVPGLARTWQVLHERYGRLPLAEVLCDAIRLAEEGCPVSGRWSSSAQALLDVLRADPGCAGQFLVDGMPPQSGSIVRQPELATTLRLIAENGPADFYEGELARKLVSGLRAWGCPLTEADLAGHQSPLVAPLSVEYRGHVIHGQPPVSQGIILLESLGLLRGTDVSCLEPGSAELTHLQVEAHRLARADRDAYLGDSGPDVRQKLLDDRYLADRAGLIDPNRAMPSRPNAGSIDHDTTYFTVADSDGNMISFIQSVFYAWGSGVCVEGVLFNNRMNGFDDSVGRPNSYAPGKRPVHTLNAYLATRDGRPAFAGGTPGADVQVQSNLQVIQNLVDFEMGPQEAIERPRWSYREPGTLEVEDRFAPDAIQALERLGHKVHRLGRWGHGSSVQVIAVDEAGTYHAGSDPRSEGEAVGW